MATECSRDQCQYRKSKPEYTVLREGRGIERWLAFCEKAQKFIKSEDTFPFPKWCPLEVLAGAA